MIKVRESIPNLIYKGDKLPVKEKFEIPTNKEETATEVATSNMELEHLKQSNKNLALENASLKKENEILKKEKEELEDKIYTLMQAAKVEKSAKAEVEKIAEEEKEPVEEEEKPSEEESKNNEEGEKDKDKNIIKEELSKKTVSQLKELLNTEDFLPYKEEWKSLTKKDDIVNYLLKKIEEK